MGKPDEVKKKKQDARGADRHNLAKPDVDAAKWARSLTTKRVADLFKTEKGLPGHWKQIQQEVDRGNKYFQESGKTSKAGKVLCKFIADAIVKAAEKADFDFPLQQLKFTSDMSWLKISKEGKRLLIKSRP